MSGEPGPDGTQAMNAESLTPPTSDAAVVPAGGGAIPAPETSAVAVPSAASEDAATAEPAAAAAVGPADAPAVVGVPRRRSLAIVAGLTRVLRFALVLAGFGFGVLLGYQYFLTSQPAPTGQVVDPATAGNLPAPVVREFIAAVARNDADAIRSAVPATPYKALTAEMSRWEINKVTSVETLATFEDGQRTATAFVMIGRDGSQNPVAINLVVETQAGNIVGFK